MVIASIAVRANAAFLTARGTPLPLARAPALEHSLFSREPQALPRVNLIVPPHPHHAASRRTGTGNRKLENWKLEPQASAKAYTRQTSQPVYRADSDVGNMSKVILLTTLVTDYI